MEASAIRKAEARLKKAKEMLHSITAARDFSEFEPAWADFLMAAGTCFSSLEQGAKGNEKSLHWYGGKKGLRRSDPVLCYVHHARNAEEHGLEPVAEHNGGGVFFGKGGESVHIERLVSDENGIRATLKPVDGQYPTVGIVAPHPALIAVYDRGICYDVPFIHLGNHIESTPIAIAKATCDFIEKMIEEAKEL